MKFRLINGSLTMGGKHYDGRGTKKPIVESDRDLVEVFGKNQFELVEETVKTSKPSAILDLPRVPGSTRASGERPGVKPVVKNNVENIHANDDDEEVDVPMVPDNLDVTTYEAVKTGRNKYDVIKCVNGNRTEKKANKASLTKSRALRLAAKLNLEQE